MWEYNPAVNKEGKEIQLLKRVITHAMVLGCFSTPLSAAVITWDGGGIDNTWDANEKGGKNGNWGGNDKIPGNGDSLQFSGSTRLTSDNNISGLSLAGIEFAALAGAFTITGNAITLAGNVTNNSSNLQTINLSLGLSAADRTFDTNTGNIAVGGQISGSFGITKLGNQQLILTASNIYTGTTNISAGSLLANNSSGSATGTGAVAVSTGATLGGTGTIAPSGSNGITVASGGFIAPGNGTTPGTLTFNFTSTTGRLTMSSGSGFQFHLGAVGIGDMLSILSNSSGDVEFNNNNIDFMGTGAPGSYKIFDTNTNNANAWTGLTVAGSGQITSGLTYSNISNGYNAIFYMGGGSYGGDTGDIYVQVIVPEPKAALLGGLGILILILRHRRFD